MKPWKVPPAYRTDMMFQYNKSLALLLVSEATAGIKVKIGEVTNIPVVKAFA